MELQKISLQQVFRILDILQWMPVISTSSGTALNVLITGMFL